LFFLNYRYFTLTVERFLNRKTLEKFKKTLKTRFVEKYKKNGYKRFLQICQKLELESLSYIFAADSDCKFRTVLSEARTRKPMAC